ncbi:MAG: S41 family peptidase [Burkholderiaceae bacterium]
MVQTRQSSRLASSQSGELLSELLAGQKLRSLQLASFGGPGLRAAGVSDAEIAEDLLDGGERLQIIDNFIAVLAGLYCHLPQKRAAYAIDPIQALRLLRPHAPAMSEAAFHLAITGIIGSLRDAHTRYSGPRSIAGAVASLPFLVEAYGPTHEPRFLVSKVSPAPAIEDPRFKAGVSLAYWNGIPFARAVDIHADRETGGRSDARLARALETLTFRSLEYGPPPDELWVDIGFTTPDEEKGEVRIPWRVVYPNQARTASNAGSRASRYVCADPAGQQIRRAKKLLFSGAAWEAEFSPRPVARAPGWLPTKFQDVLSARTVRVDGLGTFGYLRVWSFDVDEDDDFLEEVIRLLGRLPERGLIVDLRGNPGGLIWAAERMLQLLTPNPITPTRFSWVATPMTRAMAESPFNRLEIEAWAPSLNAAIATGEVYAQPLPLTDPQWCNDIGQVYGGPVVCVVDANTYSSGDLFSAGFVDNQIGTLVSVGEASGAGGANVWTSSDVRDALADTDFAIQDMPDGVSYTIAVRRALRAGAAAGNPIEDLGITGISYSMTRDDLLIENRDLLRFCAQQLTGEVRSSMRVSIKDGALVVASKGLDGLDVYVDDRPASTHAIADGVHTIKMPKRGDVMLVGSAKGTTLQRRRIRSKENRPR